MTTPITWTQFRQGLATWLSAMSGQPVECICWNGEARPVADPLIVLSITSDNDLATRVYEDFSIEGTTEIVTETSEAVRDLTVQCRIETVSQNDYEGALHIADTIRLRTAASMFNRILADAHITLADNVTGTRDFAYTSNGVTIHARGFDMYLRYLQRETIEDRNPEYFDKVGFRVTNDGVTTPEIEASAPNPEV